MVVPLSLRAVKRFVQAPDRLSMTTGRNSFAQRSRSSAPIVCRGGLSRTADPGGRSGMIGLGTGVKVYLACGVTDMRKGIFGLAMLAQDVLRQNPSSGAVFAFRGRRGDRIKLLTFDGQGFCLYYKILERGRFLWPSPADGVARLTSAQMAMLWEGIDWRRPKWTSPPDRIG